jgi:DNA-binding XRE family transcriptional regulator
MLIFSQQVKEAYIMNIEIAGRLYELRKQKNLSQEELAEKIGATRQMIIYVENKKRPLVWSVFLAMLLLFFFDPQTRPFFIAAGIISPKLSKILFGDDSVLMRAASLMESDKPMLFKAQEMMDALMSNNGEERGRL